jgi:hypothetical protein
VVAANPSTHTPNRLVGVRRVSTLLMALRIDAIRGLMRLSSAPYDETIVDWIRTLPHRHYRPSSQDWSVPARSENLRSLCGVIAELEERGIAIDITDPAAARLSRLDIGRGVLRRGTIEIAGPYSERRVPTLRALPERRFDADRKIWTVPLTRAGALAILALADETDDLVLTLTARRALQRSATGSPPTARDVGSDATSPERTPRRSPVAHWRHHTAGAIFDNPARPRINVPGIGWCVRIRVTPRHTHNRARDVQA